MEENEIVRRCGVTQEEWARMLALSNARRRRYHKGEAVLRCGDRGKELGLVEQGSVNIETVDLSGSRSILGHIPRGQVFAEIYAFCREVLMVDVTAAEESQVLFLDVHALLLPQYAGEGWQRKLLTGLLAMSTQKNLALSRRMMTTIRLNLAFSMALNLVAIVLAMTGVLNPVVGALVHNAGSVLVILNSALLLKWRRRS